MRWMLVAVMVLGGCESEDSAPVEVSAGYGSMRLPDCEPGETVKVPFRYEPSTPAIVAVRHCYPGNGAEMDGADTVCQDGRVEGMTPGSVWVECPPDTYTTWLLWVSPDPLF